MPTSCRSKPATWRSPGRMAAITKSGPSTRTLPRRNTTGGRCAVKLPPILHAGRSLAANLGQVRPVGRPDDRGTRQVRKGSGLTPCGISPGPTKSRERSAERLGPGLVGISHEGSESAGGMLGLMLRFAIGPPVRRQQDHRRRLDTGAWIIAVARDQIDHPSIRAVGAGDDRRRRSDGLFSEPGRSQGQQELSGDCMEADAGGRFRLGGQRFGGRHDHPRGMLRRGGMNGTSGTLRGQQHGVSRYGPCRRRIIGRPTSAPPRPILGRLREGWRPPALRGRSIARSAVAFLLHSRGWGTILLTASSRHCQADAPSS